MTSFDPDATGRDKSIFIELSRTLSPIYFYTSSIQKYLQARLFFDRNGLTVDYFKGTTDPYDEDYGGTKDELLVRAVEQVTGRVGRGNLVFVEDTSVRIEALSEQSQDVPGMLVKHWFDETTFHQLDTELKQAGNDRRTVVKSDIALKLPTLDRALLFHGESEGRVADRPPNFRANPRYPWLTPDSFNGWFIPEGADKPLGALPLEESLAFDFRVRAFRKLIDRLEEYAAALNLPPSAYRRRRVPAALREAQPSLFSPSQAGGPPALLIVGRTCAGKTTFAEYASGHHGFLRIEASAIVRSLEIEHLDSDDSNGFAFALRALDQLGHDIVAREIVRRYGDRLDGPVVISGLRDVEEIRYLQEVLPRAQLVLIEASERTRFERDVRRARGGNEATLSQFRHRDGLQDAFALLPIIDDLADIRVLNEGAVDDYHRQIDAVLTMSKDEPGVDLAAHPRHGLDQHQLYRCLRILCDAGSALQCDEIESHSSDLNRVRIRHNNANKVLKAYPSLARRLEAVEGERERDSARVRYEVSDAGRTYVRLFESRQVMKPSSRDR
jgi:inosine/xanthosine triphosphate pyrophosphatase family protein/dephospho-CoA kinase